MANEVKMKTGGVDVQNIDVEFDVKEDGGVVGTLKISKGTVEWRPKDFSYGFHLSWVKFSEIMQGHGVQR
jgi:hypothetical protein